MFRKHPEVIEAEERLAELRSQLADATGEKLADVQFRVTAQTKVVEELRWAHTPRPLVNADSFKPIEGVPVGSNGEPLHRAY